jgi:hypothetical protein
LIVNHHHCSPAPKFTASISLQSIQQHSINNLYQVNNYLATTATASPIPVAASVMRGRNGNSGTGNNGNNGKPGSMLVTGGVISSHSNNDNVAAPAGPRPLHIAHHHRHHHNNGSSGSPSGSTDDLQKQLLSAQKIVNHIPPPYYLAGSWLFLVGCFFFTAQSMYINSPATGGLDFLRHSHSGTSCSPRLLL